ncbi:hypothetical protein YDYSY3_57650 [Paenibacillus chitinolyticus]|uniref:hypothetical protein n=1 Tax=Paenibacillus chitinolyticus TaxID=79263 RepID=UPI0026E4B572|nr:hypothetical protein [Paenibacillus chitinolyticus]GKS14765.1 hypothetical protein YDYSY3_57650 [Paenibacillus chitinolyticus]
MGMGPGRPAHECENKELVFEFENACRAGDYGFASEYREELLKRLQESERIQDVREIFKFAKDEKVKIRDGFAYIGQSATIKEVHLSGGKISYKLKEYPGSWPQSSLEKVTF